jgi:hypothetical protein
MDSRISPVPGVLGLSDFFSKRYINQVPFLKLLFKTLKP